MKKHIARPRLVLAVLAVSVTLSAAPAFAQRAPNDGGFVPTPPGAQVDGTSVPQPTTPYYGRPTNDGGLGPQPTAAQLKAAALQNKGSQQADPPHLGRPLNDGGTLN